jgi:hypothetical protein
VGGGQEPSGIEAVTPRYLATKRFSPEDGDVWTKYVTWSNLTQLRELISIDGMLCVHVPAFKAAYWPYVAEDCLGSGFFFNDLTVLEQEIAGEKNVRLLAVLLNPGEPPPRELDAGFQLTGFDLTERDGNISSLSNCGGFPDCFDNAELSEFGLLTSHARALEVQRLLREKYPEEPHADCNVWAIYTRT